MVSKLDKQFGLQNILNIPIFIFNAPNLSVCLFLIRTKDALASSH
jgi:hypothetical protein